MESILDLNELERELCRIPEVTAARVVAGASGVIEEVHILSLPLKHAKQVVRDVQSVAMATFGLDLDRRIVSVVQLDAPPGARVASEPAAVPPVGEVAAEAAAPAPAPTAEPAAPPAPAPAAPPPPEPAVSAEPVPAEPPVPPAAAERQRREPTGIVDPTLAALAGALDVSISAPRHAPSNGATDTRINVDTVMATRSSHQATAEVVLSRGNDLSTGTAEGIGSTSSVLRLVAQATLSALRLLEPAAVRADVEAAMVVNLGSRQVALTTVVLVVPPYEEVCAGSAVVRSAGELDAVARAVLDATNRRLPQLR